MISLILGCMYSGKTTELLRRMRRAEFADQETVLYKYSKDTRYVGRAHLTCSHDNVQQMAHPVATLDISMIRPNTVIGIDEGQFIGNLVDFCEEAARQNCQVIVSALDSNFKREAFPSIAELIPKCEQIEKLHAVCFDCKKQASFTKRLNYDDSTDIESIGGTDKYKAVCRNCYY